MLTRLAIQRKAIVVMEASGQTRRSTNPLRVFLHFAFCILARWG
jgi:hypothetical protein